MFSENGAETSYHGPTTPLELRDHLCEENYALRALGVLLSTAKLSEFDSSQFLKDTQSGRKAALEAQALQRGLAQLIDLYLARQEQTLEAYVRHYLESDEWRWQSASSLVQMVKQGGFGSDLVARQKLYEAISLLNLVIAEGGPLKPMAEGLQQEALQHPLLKKTAEKAVEEVAQ